MMDLQQYPFAFRLSEVPDYRAFLRLWMAEGGRSGKPISFGEASRRFGFASRSFLSDVLRGKKSLSPQSLQSVRKGLGHLPDVVVRIFVHLAYLEQDGLRPPHMPKEKVQQVLPKLRQRARRLFLEDGRDGHTQRELDELVTQMSFHLCFAALQGGEKGETVSRVAAQTGLSQDSVSSLLERMSQSGFVECLEQTGTDPKRYRALDAHRVIEHMASPGAFHTFIVNWLSQLLRRTAAERPRSTDLFNVSTFSVKSADRPALRRRLIEAIDSVVEEFEVSQGDEIVSLTLAYNGHNPQL